MSAAPHARTFGGLQPLYSVAQVRALENTAIAGLAPHTLMQRAARAAAELALGLLQRGPSPRGAVSGVAAEAADGDVRSGMPANGDVRPGMRVLVAAGPGNNGGDAIECALLLAAQDCAVTVWLPAVVPEAPEARGAPDAPTAPVRSTDHAQALLRLEASVRAGASIRLERGTARAEALGAVRWNLVIDGLFGIGLGRPLGAPWRTVVATLNGVAARAPLLALDVPSGLDADTGCVLRIAADATEDASTDTATDTATDASTGAPADGNAGDCVRATHTITFIGDKTGLHTGSGRELAGAVTVAALGIDAALFPLPTAWRNAPAAFAAIYLPRRQDAHKGSYGDVCVIGGATGMAGAAILAAQAALKSGCGRVTIGFAQEHGAPAFIPGQPELMCRAAWPGGAAGSIDDAVSARPSVPVAATAASTAASAATAPAAAAGPAEATDVITGMMQASSCVVGPGLGRQPAAAALVALACVHARNLVLDADALNLIAGSAALQAGLAQRSGPAILTPHPLEAARLLGTTAAAVQADRLQAAQTLAARHRAIVILKGSGTLVVDGRTGQPPATLINPTGNPALATGGTGDVLAGICGALLAQGWDAFAAAAGAVWLHGAAADWLVAHGIGPVGVTAGEIIDAARTVRNGMAARRGIEASWIRPDVTSG